MIQLNSKIKIYLKNNSKVYEDEKNNFSLQDDMAEGISAPYIKKWNVDGVDKPTDAQLDALSSQATTLENNAIAVSNRQKEYGSTAKQIEFITEKGLEAWKTNVQAIKTKYPKE